MSAAARQEWMFEKAPAPYVVRAAEKDEYYKRYVVDDVEEVATRLFGTRWVNRMEQELQLAGQSAYYLLSSGGGRQSLGEEYCDLIAVNLHRMQPLTQARRIAQTLLRLVVPYLVAKYLPHLITRLAPRSQQNQLQLRAKKLVQELHRAHLAFFFIHSTYYLVSSRAAGAGLLLMNAPSPGAGGYSWFGYSILIQQAIEVFRLAKRSLWDARAGRDRSGAGGDAGGGGCSDDDEDDVSADDDADADDGGEEGLVGRCGICLGARGRRNGPTTATRCGHMFCWQCVTGLCTSSPSPLCPLCRERITLATLAPVYSHRELK